MKNKTFKVLLAVVLAVQLIVPVGMALYPSALNAVSEDKGEVYKFRVEPLFVDESGGKVYFEENDYFYGDKSETWFYNGRDRRVYGTVKAGDDGFAYIDKLSADKPKETAYIESAAKSVWKIPFEYWQTDEETADLLSNYFGLATLEEERCDDTYYITVRVYRGRATVLGFYIDDVPAREKAEGYFTDWDLS